jgi:hypothetical protein
MFPTSMMWQHHNMETTPSHSLLLSVYHTDRSISRGNIVLVAFFVVICIMSKSSMTNWQYVIDLREELSCVGKEKCYNINMPLKKL